MPNYATLGHRSRVWLVTLGLQAVLLGPGCDEPSASSGMPQPQLTGTGGSAGMQPIAGMMSAGAAGTAGAVATGGTSAPPGTGGAAGTTAGTGSADASTPSDSSVDMLDMDASASDAAQEDLNSYAGELDGLFIDVPCVSSTPLPLANMATCDHAPGTQHIERAIVFGGDASTTYTVTLRVRGIWEPTSIAGGQAPEPSVPFKVGGSVAAGNAIDYQQYSIVVSAPAQTYWLNDHQYTAHDIHKLDYEATLQVNGGANVTVIMNDGNERQIANWTQDLFSDLPPYDTAASTGQSLHLDVVSVQSE